MLAALLRAPLARASSVSLLPDGGLRAMATVPTHMRAVVAKNARCVVEERPVPVLKPGEVLVKTVYSAINRADTLQRKGQYPPPPGVTDILGLELAGEVVAYAPGGALPPTAPEVVAPGARVMALLSGGGNAEYAAVPAAHLLPVPPSLSWRDAGAVPETWLTAFQLLHLVAGVRAGQSVLIHAAGSGVGTAAVQLAAAAGCIVFAVAGTDDKLAVARRLGAAHGFNYKADAAWPAAVVASSPGRGGVDVVLDPVGGSFWRGNADALALDGTWVLYGSMGGGSVEGGLLAQILRKRIKMVGTTLRSRTDGYKAELTARFVREALPLLASGAAAPVVDSEFPLAEAQAAHERMESNANTGKILLHME
jgi:tumor protein p53-inducible protein 3